MNSTIKRAAKVAEELNQYNGNSDSNRKAFNTYKQDYESQKKNMAKPSNAWHISVWTDN
jgi:hypothetical protein